MYRIDYRLIIDSYKIPIPKRVRSYSTIITIDQRNRYYMMYVLEFRIKQTDKNCCELSKRNLNERDNAKATLPRLWFKTKQTIEFKKSIL